MAVSTYFNEELALVDATKSFTYVLNTSTHTYNEYSVSGWTVTGGSEIAQAQGADAALYDLGFRFYSPTRTYRPASVASGGVTIAKRENWMPYISFFITYGFDGEDTVNEAAYERWRVLNNINDPRLGVGHVWAGLVTSINAQDGFFTNNPTYYQNGVFLLDNGAAEAAIVERVGTYIAASEMSAYDTFAIEPNDSCPLDSEDVFRFANAVALKVRETHPNARGKLYAYGYHARPPSFECPHLDVQVALGFTSAGLGYDELVRQWGEKATFLGLRAYGDIAAWSGYLPMVDASSRATNWEENFPLVQYHGDNARGMLFETCANWVKNIVSHYYLMRLCKTGSATYDAVATEIVTNVYDGDTAVYDLFTYWGSTAPSPANYLGSCTYIDAMAASEYKLEFQRYMAAVMAHVNLLNFSRTPRYSPGFYIEAERPLRWFFGLRDHAVHGFAYIRRFDRWGLPDTYSPSQTWNAVPEPHWYRHPITPSADDYTAMKAEYTAALQYGAPEEVLDEVDLVVVDVMPSGGAGGASTPPSTVAYSRSAAVFWAQGPGTLTVHNATETGVLSGETVYELEAGLHRFETSGGFRVSMSTGLVWIDGFYGLDFHYAQWPETRQPSWVYAPHMLRGKFNVSSSARLVLISSAKTHYIQQALPPFSQTTNPDPAGIEPGVVKIDTTTTAKDFYLSNLNRWVSLHPRKMLMPRALAKLEFPSVSFGDAA